MAKYHLVRYYPENEFLLRIAKGDEVSCFMTAIMRHCSDEQRIYIRDMLIERTPKDTKKEKEIAELVDCLQETIRCCAVFKDNMLSADVTISEHCDQIEVAKQILKKHNP